MENENEFLSIHIASMVFKKLQGQLNSIEQAELETLLKASAEHQRIYDEIVYEHEQNTILDSLSRYDKHAAFERFTNKTSHVKLIARSIFYKAAIAIAAIVALFIFRIEITNWINPVKLEFVETAKAERKKITLSDGTEIWLSPLSTIKYPEIFRSATRDVELKGEAFFKVAKDKEHPFTVHTGEVITTVLGTEFNVQSYGERETIDVTLLSGKVELSADNNKVVLKPFQQVVFTKASSSFIKRNYPNAQKFLSRREGVFNYDGQLVKEVISDLQKQFGIVVHADRKINDKLFYGTFNIKQGPEKAIQALCLTINASYQKNITEYRLSANQN